MQVDPAWGVPTDSAASSSSRARQKRVEQGPVAVGGLRIDNFVHHIVSAGRLYLDREVCGTQTRVRPAVWAGHVGGPGSPAPSAAPRRPPGKPAACQYLPSGKGSTAEAQARPVPPLLIQASSLVRLSTKTSLHGHSQLSQQDRCCLRFHDGHGGFHDTRRTVAA